MHYGSRNVAPLWLGVSFLLLLAGHGHSGETTATTAALPEGELSLIVNLTGLDCCQGIWRLAVYHDKSQWLRDSGMARGRIGMVTAASERVEIHGLPAGTYAVAVYQDRNSDGKLNRLLGLMPREPYGFSNNVGKYAPASFNKAAIDLRRDMEITIDIHRGRR